MQRSLRLISLSNYVFVLEISQISGIVQNVSMLIMVVMRIVAVVGEEKRKGAGREGVPLEPKARLGPNPFIKHTYLVMGAEAPCPAPGIHRKNVPCACEAPLQPPPPSIPVQGCTYLWQTTKRSPLIFSACASAARVSQHQGCECLTRRHFLILPPCEVLQLQG